MYKNCLSFSIFTDKVYVISDQTAYGRNTVVDIDGHYIYLGDEYPGMAAAIFAWQEFYKKDFSIAELTQILTDNNLL